jgi:hypothetical protein
MTTSAMTPKASRPLRIALLLLVALLGTGAPLHAGPLTGLISSAAAIVKSAVTLPFYVTSKAVQGVTKNSGKTGITVTQK